MDDIDNNNSTAVDIATRLLYDGLRATNGQNKELRVKIEVHVGGRSYFRNLHSPVIDGDEFVTHEVPQRDF